MVTVLAVVVAACGGGGDGDSSGSTAAPSGESEETFKIGTQSDGYRSVANEWLAEHVAPRYGIKVEPVQIAEYTQLALATHDGNLDGYWAATPPYIGLLNKEEGLEAVALAPIDLQSFSLRSEKYESASELPDGATILIPDDPVSTAIGLSFLQQEGLIKLDPKVPSYERTVKDVVSNPENLKFTQTEPVQAPRSLPDVDAVFSVDLLWVEADLGSNVHNLGTMYGEDETANATSLAVNADDADKPGYEKLREAYESPRFAAYLKANFGDVAKPVDRSVVEGWKVTDGLEYVTSK